MDDADKTGHELLAEVGWRSEPRAENDHRQGRRIFDAAGYDLDVMSVFGVRELLSMRHAHWTRDEDGNGSHYYTRLDDTIVLTVDYRPDRDSAEGIAEPGGWRFGEDGVGPSVPYHGSHDARHALHDTAVDAMRAADAWLKAVRK